MRRIVLIAGLLAGLLAGPAAAALPRPPSQDRGAHAYVLGRFALAEDRLDDAAAYFSGALRGMPDDGSLARRAFDVALAAGNRDLALRLADQVAATGQTGSFVALLRAVDALDRRDWRGYDAGRSAYGDAGAVGIVGPILDAWGLQARGDLERAQARLASSPTPRGPAASYLAEHQANLLAVAGRWPEAAEAYKAALVNSGVAAPRLRRAAGAALVAAGQTTEAISLLGQGAVDDPLLSAARDALVAGRPVGGVPRVAADGVALLFTRVAADLGGQQPTPAALAFARLATFASPRLADGWLATGELLARAGHEAPAMAALRQVPASDPLHALAQARIAAALEADGRREEARTLLERLATAPGAGSDEYARLGDFLRRAGDHRAAAVAYGRAAAVVPQQSGWMLRFFQGAALEQAGDWAGAEPVLRQAMAAAPDDPTVLNYLGYSLLDRGQKLDEARTLIERAAARAPDNGAIIDSLGWAQFLAGDVDRAVETLERAVRLEPDDPTVHEHLGDAYWTVGRRTEARYRWQAALDLDPPAVRRADIAAKLLRGLEAKQAAR